MFIDEPVARLLCAGDLPFPREARHVVLRAAGDLRGRSGGDEVATIDGFALNGERARLQLCFSDMRQQSLLVDEPTRFRVDSGDEPLSTKNSDVILRPAGE